YAGGGNLTRALCHALVAERIVAVEGDPVAGVRLAAIAAARPAGEVTVRAEPAAQAAAALSRQGERFDVVVLDPPRAGAEDVVPWLGRLGARRVVYVSCDPMTLGRDLLRLRAQGFAIRAAQPIDLTPHTAHVETVAVAERAGS